MAHKPAAKNQQLVLYWLLMGTVGLICIFIIFLAFSMYDRQEISRRYNRPFEQRAMNAREVSKKSYAPGMREKDIRKTKGRRYETY